MCEEDEEEDYALHEIGERHGDVMFLVPFQCTGDESCPGCKFAREAEEEKIIRNRMNDDPAELQRAAERVSAAISKRARKAQKNSEDERRRVDGIRRAAER